MDRGSPVPGIMRPMHCLAIHRHNLADRTRPYSPYPSEEMLLKHLRIHGGKYPSKGSVGGNAIRQAKSVLQLRLFGLPKRFDRHSSVRTTDHGTHRNRDDIDERMLPRALDAGIR